MKNIFIFESKNEMLISKVSSAYCSCRIAAITVVLCCSFELLRVGTFLHKLYIFTWILPRKLLGKRYLYVASFDSIVRMNRCMQNLHLPALWEGLFDANTDPHHLHTLCMRSFISFCCRRHFWTRNSCGSV